MAGRIDHCGTVIASHRDRDSSTIFKVDTRDRRFHHYVPAACDDLVAAYFPHHSGSIFRILEFLDERGDLFLVSLGLQRIDNGVAQTETLHALRCPVRRHVLDRNAPHLLRVGLEELAVQAPAKASHQPALVVVLILRGANLSAGVRTNAEEGFEDAEIPQCVRSFEGIVVVLALKEDATHSWAEQEVFVREDLVPEGLYFVNLCEESMATNVESPSIPHHRLGDSADHLGPLEDGDRSPTANDLERRSEAGRAGTDYHHGCFRSHGNLKGRHGGRA